ncbi:conserved hypothetical protein [Frankia canadensis]|uniref:Uncharacterized protein n=1 Tax=Frankia canadensis TaxID=1836972 RepID=A0A2I2KW91_9ACTN|nr:conserved hypothetical protein [Frankia canadensis]SOU57210.1 conserved hypothetical protein [Frankia canadensis]
MTLVSEIHVVTDPNPACRIRNAVLPHRPLVVQVAITPREGHDRTYGNTHEKHQAPARRCEWARR